MIHSAGKESSSSRQQYFTRNEASPVTGGPYGKEMVREPPGGKDALALHPAADIIAACTAHGAFPAPQLRQAVRDPAHRPAGKLPFRQDRPASAGAPGGLQPGQAQTPPLHEPRCRRAAPAGPLPGTAAALPAG